MGRPLHVRLAPTRSTAVAASGRERLRRLAESWKAPREAFLEHSGVQLGAADIHRISHGKLDATPALKASRSWLRLLSEPDPPRFLILAGGVGVGKTTAAAWALARWCPRCPTNILALVEKAQGCIGDLEALPPGEEIPRGLRESIFRVFAQEAGLNDRGARTMFGHRAVTMTEVTKVMNPWERGSSSRAREAEIRKACLLVIDDVGRESQLTCADADAALLELVDDRQSHPPRFTILTTNLSRRALVDRYDARTIDRLDEAGEYVPLAGPSLRRRRSGLRDAPTGETR